MQKFFLSCCLTSFMLSSTPSISATSDSTSLESLPPSFDANLFAEIFENSSHTETPVFNNLSLRQAREVDQSTNLLEKIQKLATRCYAHIVCRYYLIQKWLLRLKQQSQQTSNS